MMPNLNIGSTGNVFAVGEAPVIGALQDAYKKDVKDAKTFPQLKPLARLSTGLFEGLVCVFVVFYLLAVVALSGALLFYTFTR
ncbi:MAG: hypothetical protein JO025_22120 [Verrucomicrobia bacterium]|nr:hypothetical protein [Verrucomicrobiota bacterium]